MRITQSTVNKKHRDETTPTYVQSMKDIRQISIEYKESTR